MKALISCSTFIPSIGNTGYANSSKLILRLENIGLVTLPNDKWDLNGVPVDKIKELWLTIPSGTLYLYHSFDVITSPDGWEIEAQGEWDGKIAGLEGGMSGYIGFTAIIDKIIEGTYLRSEERIHGIEPVAYFERVEWHRLTDVNAYTTSATAANCIREQNAVPEWWEKTLEKVDNLTEDDKKTIIDAHDAKWAEKSTKLKASKVARQANHPDQNDDDLEYLEDDTDEDE